MIVIDLALLSLTIVLNYKNNNWVASVEIQIVSFSYPTDKILKTSNDFVTLSKTMWTKAGVSTTHGVAFGRPFFFFVRIGTLRLGVDLQGWQSKGYATMFT